MTTIKKLAAGLLSAALILAGGFFVPQAAFAGGQSPAAGTTPLDGNAVRDGNGVIMSDDDIGEKVFEVIASAGAFQVLNEASETVTRGILKKVCIESGTPGLNFAVVADTSDHSTISVTTTARRLIPPIGPTTTAAHRCEDFNVQFHRGLVVRQSHAGTSTYVYYKTRARH